MDIYRIPRLLDVCPICGGKVEYRDKVVCLDCHEEFEYDFERKVFRNPNIVDISYKDPESSILSNLFPHTFTMSMPYTFTYPIRFASMEAFLRSLCWTEDSTVIEQEIAPLFGVNAVNVKFALPDWKKNQRLLWDGKIIYRESKEYEELIAKAFHSLVESSALFRRALQKTGGKFLVHTIGKTNPKETLLTADEFITCLKKERDNIYRNCI